ncbi:MAG: hypothetical protein AMXMBFR60_07280 [Chloroflexota bacterium]
MTEVTRRYDTAHSYSSTFENVRQQNINRHCEGGALPKAPEAIPYIIGDCFAAKSKSAARNDGNKLKEICK